MKSGRVVLAIFFIALYFAEGYSQLHESLEVVGEYDPEIILQEKINVFPETVNLTLPVRPMNYEEEGVDADFRALLYPMPATGWKASYDFLKLPGYVELGLGSWLNSELSAGYRFVDKEALKAGMRLQFNSTSLWKPVIDGVKSEFSQYRYDGIVGVYGSYSFKNKGNLFASFDYGFGSFNYYGAFLFPEFYRMKDKLPDQRRNEIDFRVGWFPSEVKNKSFVYALNAGVRYFGYKNLPLPYEWNVPQEKGLKETDINVGASLLMPELGDGKAALDAMFDMLVYSGVENKDITAYPGIYGVSLFSKPDNYGILKLKPNYSWQVKGFDIKLGVELDFCANAGLKDDKYPFFHIAPDVMALWKKGKGSVWLALRGGSELNTMASERQNDYYGSPALSSTRPSYVPLDGKFGFSVSPFKGFEFRGELSYKIMKNVPLGGWYQSWLEYGSYPLRGMNDVSYADNSTILYCLDNKGINLHGLRIEGKIGYQISDILKLSARGAWQPQNGETGYFDGYDRPRVTASFEGTVSPVKSLDLSLSYDYRGVRRIYSREYVDPFASGGVINGESHDHFVSMRLPDLCLLNFSVEWKFNKNFGIWLRASNLLNQHTEILPLQPMQGIDFLAGFSWKF